MRKGKGVARVSPARDGWRRRAGEARRRVPRARVLRCPFCNAFLEAYVLYPRRLARPRDPVRRVVFHCCQLRQDLLEIEPAGFLEAHLEALESPNPGRRRYVPPHRCGEAVWEACELISYGDFRRLLQVSPARARSFLVSLAI